MAASLVREPGGEGVLKVRWEREHSGHPWVTNNMIAASVWGRCRFAYGPSFR